MDGVQSDRLVSQLLRLQESPRFLPEGYVWLIWGDLHLVGAEFTAPCLLGLFSFALLLLLPNLIESLGLSRLGYRAKYSECFYDAWGRAFNALSSWLEVCADAAET